MITIQTVDDNHATLKVDIGTPHFTMVLGIEMLIEALIEEVKDLTIDSLLADLKRIYERDNKKEE